MLVQDGLWRRLAESRHRNRVAILSGPRAPAKRRGRLHRHARPHAAREDALAVVVVLLGESVEAASPLGWSTWIGDDGDAIAMTTFGQSAPQPDLYEHFGFTAEKVAERARAVVERVSARA